VEAGTVPQVQGHPAAGPQAEEAAQAAEAARVEEAARARRPERPAVLAR